MSHDNQWVTVYEQLVATRNVEAETQWARYNVLAVINTALFAAPAANNELFKSDFLWVWIPISLLGIVFSTAWLGITRRGHWMVGAWNDAIKQLESSAIPGDLHQFGDVIANAGSTPPSIRSIAEVLPSVCIAAWFIGLIVVIGRIVTTQAGSGT